MKKIRRTLGILLVVMILLSGTTVLAVNDTDKDDGLYGLDYVGIATLYGGLSISGTGLATCSGSVRLSNNTYTVYLVVALEQYSGGSWSSVAYWQNSGSGYSGTDVVAYRYVAHGTYRVRSTGTVFDQYGSFVEQASVYSPSRTY